jgi:hypothetical protein
MKFASALVSLTILYFVSAASGLAQDMPPNGNLAQMVTKLGKKLPTDVSISATNQPVAPACKLQRFDVTLSRGADRKYTYSILSDPDGPGASRRNVLAVSAGLAVDADGSARAYHPEDPTGSGTCTLTGDHNGGYYPSGGQVCAIDNFSDGGIAVFKGTTQVRDGDLADDWRQFWSLIRDKKLTPYDLARVSGMSFGYHYYFFYWKQRDMTVFFKDENVQRTSDGYPCTRGGKSRFAGYFVAATTLKHDSDHAGAEIFNPVAVAPAECQALRDIDAEMVPYFVIPGGTLGQATIGDVVVARVKTDGGERIVYGVAADEGPIRSFGEGSAALNQLLLSKTGPVINNAALDKLDISRTAVTILILGGTRQLLKGNFSRANIETVAHAEFVRWGRGADPAKRLNACIAEAKVNPRY